MRDGSTACLTDAEREVLRIFLTVSDPKVIAARIDRSHHEVDRRFRSARAKLGVSRTLDAARMLEEADRAEAYEPAPYQPPVPVDAPTMPATLPVSERSGGWRRFFPSRERPWLAEPVWPRMIAIAGFAVLIVMAAILCVSLGEALSRIARH